MAETSNTFIDFFSNAFEGDGSVQSPFRLWDAYDVEGLRTLIRAHTGQIEGVVMNSNEEVFLSIDQRLFISGTEYEPGLYVFQENVMSIEDAYEEDYDQHVPQVEEA